LFAKKTVDFNFNQDLSRSHEFKMRFSLILALMHHFPTSHFPRTVAAIKDLFSTMPEKQLDAVIWWLVAMGAPSETQLYILKVTQSPSQ